MAAAIELIGCTNCKVLGAECSDVDAGVDVSGSVGTEIRGLKVSGGVAIKGSGVKKLTAVDVAHTFTPRASYLARAIRSAIYGNV